MARIRTVKPEFFRHEGLQDLEAANPGKYVMLVFCGLWCIADREGRFEWKPRQLKLDILPFLDFDMNESLTILADAEHIKRYEVEEVVYGMIVNWARHQLVGRDEPASEIPAPSGNFTLYHRPPNATVRARIYQRDQYACVYCGKDLRSNSRAICLDHVVPYARGGTNTEGNLATACKSCNGNKGARTPFEAGLRWPEGLGERYTENGVERVVPGALAPVVDGGLTGGQHPTDAEREKEREKEEEQETETNAALLLIVALNQGLHDNSAIGEMFNPVPAGHAKSVEAAEAIVAAGVPLAFARSAVYEIAKAYKPEPRSRQIKSLSYCTNAVIARWEQHQAITASETSPRPDAVPSASPRVRGYSTGSRIAQMIDGMQS